MTNDEVDRLIEEIDNGPALNNPWETTFLDSVMKQRKMGIVLSAKQIGVLEGIVEKQEEKR